MKRDTRYYLYVIFRPTGEPCYVGKGTGKRWCNSAQRGHNTHLKRIWKMAGGSLPVVVVRDGLTNEEALEFEIAWIAALGRERDGGPLVNLTDGGDGAHGYVPTPEARERQRAALVGRKFSDEHRAAISQAAKARVFSPETRAKLSAGHTRQMANPEMRARISATTKGRPKSEETKERMRAEAKRRSLDPEYRARCSAAAYARWARKKAMAGS